MNPQGIWESGHMAYIFMFPTAQCIDAMQRKTIENLDWLAKEEEGILIRDRILWVTTKLPDHSLDVWCFRNKLNCCMWDCAKNMEFCQIAPKVKGAMFQE